MENLISLRLRHPSADLSAIAKEIGLEPHRAWMKGDARQTPKAQPLEGHYDSSYVTVQIEAGTDSVNDVLQRLCDRLAGHMNRITEIRNTGGSLEVYITLAAGHGLSIDHATLLRLGELGLSLELDCFE